jgi:hypothetical protein
MVGPPVFDNKKDDVCHVARMIYAFFMLGGYSRTSRLTNQ